MPLNADGLYERIWKFIDRFEAGESIARADLDTALDDLVTAFNTHIQSFESLAGTIVRGTQPTVWDLPSPGELGDMWFVGEHLYVWNVISEQWDDVGSIRGPKGDKGDQGDQGVQGDKGDPGDMSGANNLSELTNAAAARSNLGLGTAAVVALTTLMPKAGGDFSGVVATLAVTEARVAVTGATPSLDLATATVFTHAMTADTTYALTNVPASGAWVRSLLITADGAHVPTWPGAWDWGGDGPPDAFPAAGGVLELSLRAEGTGTVRASQTWRKDN